MNGCFPAVLPGEARDNASALAGMAEREFLDLGHNTPDLWAETDPQWFWGVRSFPTVAAAAAMPAVMGALQAQSLERTVRAALVAVELEPGNWVEATVKFIERHLVFNGLDVQANLDLGMYARFGWRNGAAAQVVSFEPDIVIVVVQMEYSQLSNEAGAIVEQIEARWSSVAPKPTYLVTGADQTLLVTVSKHPDVAPRVLGTQATDGGEENAISTAFKRRFSNFTGSSGDLSWFAARGYDAVYLLAIAAAAVGEGEPVTAEPLRNMLQSLNPPGTRYAVGPDDLAEVIAVLRAGADVDLEGATGSLTFPQTQMFGALARVQPLPFSRRGSIIRARLERSRDG